MVFNLPHNATLNTTDRHEEFVAAVTYLLETFPPRRTTHIEVFFLKKDGVNFSANGDYTSVDFPGCFNPLIRVTYGRNGKASWAIPTLFHEYKHMLQDDDGYLYAEETKHLNHCLEAQAWADKQLPIYLKSLEAHRG